MRQRARVQNVTVSADGCATGEGQSLERPLGHADPGALVGWGFATASWPTPSDQGGSRGLDNHFIRDFSHGIGAEIMGRNEFGPQRGPWDDHERLGWWGDTPPFHTPVFVLTHHPRRSRSTTPPPTYDPTEFDDRFHHETIPSASGVTHHVLWHRDS